MAFPDMPDVSGILTQVQTGIDGLSTMSPPSIEDIGNFLLGAVGKLASGSGLSDVFSGMQASSTETPIETPTMPDGTALKVPQVPKNMAPFKMPF